VSAFLRACGRPLGGICDGFAGERLILPGQEPVNGAFKGLLGRLFLHCGENGLAEYGENMLRNERKLRKVES
jgi:hypothetical protein